MNDITEQECIDLENMPIALYGKHYETGHTPAKVIGCDLDMGITVGNDTEIILCLVPGKSMPEAIYQECFKYLIDNLKEQYLDIDKLFRKFDEFASYGVSQTVLNNNCNFS